MRTILLASLTFLVTANPAIAEEWIVEASYSSAAMLASVGGRFQHVIVDEERRVLIAETDARGIQGLEDAGLDVRIDIVATATLRDLYTPGASLRSIPAFACYRTVEETATSGDDIVQAHPGIAAWHEIGPSWQREFDANSGYPMRALRVTNLATSDSATERPRMVMLGSIHAREYAPAELLTRMAEWLVTGYGIDAQATWLVDHVDFRFVLHANPDGRKNAEGGVLWRKNVNPTNDACSAEPPGSSYHAGIDLNRNFPFHWNSVFNGSSGYACDAIYRGPSPASEPETRNLVRYVAGTLGADNVYVDGALPDRKADDVSVAAPDDYRGLFFDIHSFGGLLLWPWGDVVALAPNAVPLQTLGRRIAWFNNYSPRRAVQLYPTDGGTIDTFYGQLGAPSFVMEIGTTFFQDCSTFENAILPRNIDALKYAARAAHAPYRLPAGPDVAAITLDRNRVIEGAPVHVTARIDDRRYRTTTPAQPTYAIVAAKAFVGVPPWNPAAVAIDLLAVDGSFNTDNEVVSGSIATSGLSAGRHLVFVQGMNSATSAGTPGTPDAVFVDVIAAADAILIDGFDPTQP